MRILSKSKLIAWRQCPKRLWLELHAPDLREDSAATQASFAIGHQVGDVARQHFDPAGRGALIDIDALGFDGALARTAELLHSAQPIFEAGFRAAGAMAFADVLLPVRAGAGRARGWRMIEVKSSGEVKDYHRDDAAIQSYVAKAAGLRLEAVAVAHIDTRWCYPGGGDYSGLLQTHDLTAETFARHDEVRQWIAEAQSVAARRKAPAIATGKHCATPYECGFRAYCEQSEQSEQSERSKRGVNGSAAATHPIAWLPGRTSVKLAEHIAAHDVTDMRDLPDALLNDLQRRVKHATVSGRPYFDREAAAAALAAHKRPAYFLDFETISFAVPIWAGTRPYQPIAFQFSLHRLSRTGQLQQRDFLDLSGADPSPRFADALLAACGERGPIFVYNASFEATRIRELAARLPRRGAALLALLDRLVDLHPIAKAHYYHPQQAGSWSIKAVLPAVCPELDYAALDGVQDGGMAMQAYAEATAAATAPERKALLAQQLREYCRLDTYAMVRLWAVFSGSTQAL